MNHNCFGDRDPLLTHIIYASCAGQCNGDANGHFMYKGTFEKLFACGLCNSMHYVLIHVCPELRPTPACVAMCGDCVVRGMLTDGEKGMFRPQRHNTPLATTLGLLVLLSEIENITEMLASKHNATPFHKDNLENLIQEHPNLRAANPMHHAHVCPLCDVAIADADPMNAVGAHIVECTQCLHCFHKDCIDMPIGDPRPANWVCLCCKRTAPTTRRSTWTWDLEIEKRIDLTPPSCQANRLQNTNVIDGVVRVWKDNVCIFFIVGTPSVPRSC